MFVGFWVFLIVEYSAIYSFWREFEDYRHDPILQ